MILFLLLLLGRTERAVWLLLLYLQVSCLTGASGTGPLHHVALQHCCSGCSSYFRALFNVREKVENGKAWDKSKHSSAIHS